MLDGRPAPESPEEALYLERMLSLPYSFILIPDGEKGGYSGQILEFPGCLARGETPAEAHENLIEAARAWIRAALDSRYSIPPPLEHLSHGSGVVRLRMPKNLHARAVRIALSEGVTVEDFALATIAETIGEVAPIPDSRGWAPRAERAFALLEKAPEQLRGFLTPILLRALGDVGLRPFIELITTDPFFQHLLEGKDPEPFL